MPENVKVLTLLDAADATGESGSHTPRGRKATFQAVGSTTAGAGTATVKVQVSNDEEIWLDAASIALTLATIESSDGFTLDAPWKFVRANLTALTGTGAEVSVFMGS